MKTRPAAATASAKSPLWLKKPYPGWTASAPVRRAASTRALTFRYEAAASAGPIGVA